MRPNFIVIGAMKCATTSLCSALAQHAQIFVSNPKEPSFFSDDQIFARGMGWYESLFAGATGKIAIGEGSTFYTQLSMFPGAAPRIAAHLPDVRLIYIVRHPMERIESHWMHNLAGTLSAPRNFNTAVRQTPDYVDTSLYDRQLGAYRAHFAEDRILVIFFEDWKKDPSPVLSRCYDFLRVEQAPPPAGVGRPRHVSQGKIVEAPIMRDLRRLPGAASALRMIPRSVRLQIQARIGSRIESRPTWDVSTYRWAAAQIEADARGFLERYGKPRDFWNFDPPGGAKSR